MSAKMPIGKLISHVLKYLAVFLVTCVIITLIGMVTIANVMAEQESAMRMDVFRRVVDSAQTLFF